MAPVEGEGPLEEVSDQDIAVAFAFVELVHELEESAMLAAAAALVVQHTGVACAMVPSDNMTFWLTWLGYRCKRRVRDSKKELASWRYEVVTQWCVL